MFTMQVLVALCITIAAVSASSVYGGGGGGDDGGEEPESKCGISSQIRYVSNSNNECVKFKYYSSKDSYETKSECEEACNPCPTTTTRKPARKTTKKRTTTPEDEYETPPAIIYK